MPRKAPRMNASPDLSRPRTLSATVGLGLGLTSVIGGGAAGEGAGSGGGGAESEGEEEEAMARRQVDSRSKKPSGASGCLLLLGLKKASSGQRCRLFFSFLHGALFSFTFPFFSFCFRFSFAFFDFSLPCPVCLCVFVPETDHGKTKFFSSGGTEGTVERARNTVCVCVFQGNFVQAWIWYQITIFTLAYLPWLRILLDLSSEHPSVCLCIKLINMVLVPTGMFVTYNSVA